MAEDVELRRLRRRIDALDRRIVALLHERASLVLDVGRTKQALGRRAIRDLDREREVLVRIAMANDGPLPQADLLAFYRSLMAASRRLEAADRRAARVRASLEGSAGSRGSAGSAGPRGAARPSGSRGSAGSSGSRGSAGPRATGGSRGSGGSDEERGPS